ncbi:hypothetical protein P7C70_g5952, partial [Phenoliferia sp. Uapishka_3]
MPSTRRSARTASSSPISVNALSVPYDVLIMIIKLVPRPIELGMYQDRVRHPADIKALRQLSLVSHLFRSIAQPILYSNIHVTFCNMARLAASEAYSRYRVKELTLDRSHEPARFSLAKESKLSAAQKALIEGAGQRGLESLSVTGSGRGFDANLLSLAGPNLKALALNNTIVQGDEPAAGWSMPYQLVHLSLRHASITNPFLSFLVTSNPTLQSLEILSPGPGPGIGDFYTYAAFPSLAAQIKSLAIQEVHRGYLHVLSHFTSVERLAIFPPYVLMERTLDILEGLPGAEGMVTHLTLNAQEHDLLQEPEEAESFQARWQKIMRSDVLKALKVVTWTRVGESEGRRIGFLSAGREADVTMKWGITPSTPR